MSTSDFKFRVVGSGGVGKSALTVRFLHPDTFLTGVSQTADTTARAQSAAPWPRPLPALAGLSQCPILEPRARDGQAVPG